MADVYLVDRAFGLSRVFAANAVGNDFPIGALQPRLTEPGTLADPAGVLEDGIVTITDQDIDRAPRLIWLQPLCDGGPGQSFAMNVWGWSRLGAGANLVWVPVFLAQLQCQSASIQGPQPAFPPSKSLLRENEWLCDTLSVNLGTLGSGLIQSNPGTDYAGWVEIDAQGCHKFQVECAGSGTFGMNALWRPA